ncbi:MAG: N-acetylmuramoyl-L-alanine amidase [Legionella sp.]|nr:MAG: N-acetylmuramoyl-L-alanine amidase [Legionella sp.]PJD97709.1 MAG: N-acetylmuramoyl-L-alanine amidase [Legionella sp.]
MKRQSSLWLVLFLMTQWLGAAQLTAVSLEQTKNKVSLYFAVQGPFTHKVFTLAYPERVVLDLNSVQPMATVSGLTKNNQLIKQARSATINGHTLRIVFDVAQRVQVSSSAWSSQGILKGIKVDLQAQNGLPAPAKRPAPDWAEVKTKKQSNPVLLHKVTAANKAQHSLPMRKTKGSKPTALRDVIVVLDAGHGGKDPGARGPKKSQEKQVVLAITLKLKQLINQQPGMRAVLTRSGDYYVGLRERLDIARQYNGDIFVSIHADAFNNPHSNGVSVFALSQSGATSEAARWIAEKENYSELGGVNLEGLDDRNGVVRSVLIDLSQTATINASLEMGGRVLNQLNRITRLHNQHVEQARFMVLKSPDIPSILVETGFISNPVEERNLNNPAYQNRLCQAIFAGIKGYFWDNPPSGSRIEAQLVPRYHRVQKGETLPAIAARYKISTAALLRKNHLTTQSVIRPGQRLEIVV